MNKVGYFIPMLLLLSSIETTKTYSTYIYTGIT